MKEYKNAFPEVRGCRNGLENDGSFINPSYTQTNYFSKGEETKGSKALKLSSYSPVKNREYK
jgi:hypothetical protein